MFRTNPKLKKENILTTVSAKVSLRLFFFFFGHDGFFTVSLSTLDWEARVEQHLHQDHEGACSE